MLWMDEVFLFYHLKINIFNCGFSVNVIYDTNRYLPHYCSDKGLKSKVMNRQCHLKSLLLPFNLYLYTSLNVNLYTSLCLKGQ